MGLLSLMRLHGGGLGGGVSSFTRNRGRYVQIVSDMGMSSHRGPCSTEGNLEFDGEALIPGTLKDG